MTSPSKPSRQTPLDREILADWIVHAVGLISGLVGAIGLVVVAARVPQGHPLVPVSVYIAGLLAMLTYIPEIAASNYGLLSESGMDGVLMRTLANAAKSLQAA